MVFSLIHIIVAFSVLFIKHIAALGTFEFDFHNKYSDSVKEILNIDELPEKGTFQYYASMVHHDHRRLATKVNSVPLTFAAGNMTVQIDELGYLHYAVVSIGTPSKTFLVALDTGSDLAWIPCDCTDCPRSFMTKKGKKLDLNIYSPSASRTSSIIPCNSSKCISGQCLDDTGSCRYKITYGDESSSSGILVEDMLHLVTNDDPQKAVHTSVTLGCGMHQTGGLLTGGGLNGLFGLGADSISLPSMLANKNVTADSFSMCFGENGVGKIVFGDKGSSSQAETPYFVHSLFPTYSITMRQISVGGEVKSVDFAAIFDSGTSFTYLQDPAYSIIANSFNSQVQDSRYHNISEVLFEFCYNLRETPPNPPKLSFTAEGGSSFDVTTPIAMFSNQERNGNIYCLTIIKSENMSIIGQNFMRGHQIVFNRERKILGWQESDCSATPPPYHSSTPPHSPLNNQLVPPPRSPIPHRSGAVYPDGARASDSTSSGLKLMSFFSRKLLVLCFEQLFLSIYSINY
ncbi:aspartic protease [Lithospermum erythrorhizon]|uniref:Aspartic protease n=1 Tax=Lithospermum erythrorhizon TaxID=34254 RepID=A0AAV3NKJ9_LITER